MTNIVHSLCVYEAIIRIGSLKQLTNIFKIVKNIFMSTFMKLQASNIQLY